MPCKTAVCFLRKSYCPCGAHGSLLSALISRQCSSQYQQTNAAPKVWRCQTSGYPEDKTTNLPPILPAHIKRFPTLALPQNPPFQSHPLNSPADSATTGKERSTFRPAPDSTHDWIGPPDLVSNLRPIVYCIPENETELEKCLRNLRQETEDWNHEFWTKQNITFRKEKDAYITSMFKAQGLSQRDEQGRKRTLNSEEMAVFYKSFLDNNRIRHSNYNKEWYKRNFTITLYMARVVLRSIWRNITERLRIKKKNTPAT